MSEGNNILEENMPKEPRLGFWEVRQSARGYKYRVWRRAQRMPQIPQRYLDCSIYLYDSKRSADDGDNFGGSGCLVQVTASPFYYDQSPNGRYNKVIHFPPHIYAVTNKHVARGGFPVIRLNTIDDKTDVLELKHEDWIPHPEGDDLAVAPIDLPERKHSYFPISNNLFLTRTGIHSSVSAGADTFMVGRFISHAGKQRNTPSLRFGSIAMMPFDKVKLESGHMQEAFLVETRSISGYSGSPVFFYRPIEQRIPIPLDRYNRFDSYTDSITNLVGHLTLLGIDCGHVPHYEKVVDGSGKSHPHGWRIRSNTGMAIVIPAWRLEDLLNIKELVMQREEINKKWKEEKEAEDRSGNVVFDVEKPEGFTKEDYQDALWRASRKISQHDEEKK